MECCEGFLELCSQREWLTQPDCSPPVFLGAAGSLRVGAGSFRCFLVSVTLREFATLGDRRWSGPGGQVSDWPTGWSLSLVTALLPGAPPAPNRPRCDPPLPHDLAGTVPTPASTARPVHHSRGRELATTATPTAGDLHAAYTASTSPRHLPGAELICGLDPSGRGR